MAQSKDVVDKERLNIFLERMIHAPDEEAYNDLRAELDRIASENFKDYFRKNWNSIKDTWVRYLCDKHFNLGNTINRAECHNSKMKAVLNTNDKLHATVRSMLKLHSMKVIEAEHRHAINSTAALVTYQSSCDLIEQFASVLMPFATKIVLREEGRARLSKASVKESRLGYTVSTEKNVNVVTQSLTRCSCTTFATMGTLCRHIILVSQQKELPVNIAAATNARWNKTFQPYVSVQGTLDGTPNLQHAQLEEPDCQTTAQHLEEPNTTMPCL